MIQSQVGTGNQFVDLPDFAAEIENYAANLPCADWLEVECRRSKANPDVRVLGHCCLTSYGYGLHMTRPVNETLVIGEGELVL